ncbi:insulinase family protein [Gilvimarinus sp. F26214L]|uniref:insulinase family protein n=1 Tax=Gilvimarinus sp. DZF01 TaxID=3461371 RepID=UPI00404684D6
MTSTSAASSTAASSPTENGFRLLRSHRIEALNITVEEYEHEATGAAHIHLAADNDENVFMVALRTVPHDSTGVAHILEHTALCGSEKFPVRDPFFMMIRRSLNTFMNAMTSSDWTAYPFASQNRKDFDNLLGVYLDAVFFSRLDPLDFAQEGHRLEFAEPDNPQSDLVYKGVVFNEMKGAMSSVPAQLWQTLCKYLYPTTTYHYNSGGDPESIVDLTYEQLTHFYRTHYHPSNAIFMTFGDIPAAEHQRKFETLALNRFDKLPDHIFVPPEKRYHAPLRVQEAYPYSEEGHEAKDGAIPDKTHIVMGWLLGRTTDLEATLEAQLLTSVLFDNSASPLQHALETTELGSAPSPLCGLDDSQHELTFVCGLEGSNNESADAVEKLILDTLARVAAEGVPYEEVKASLHQLELQQREIGGDGYPYGLQLALTALTAATHRGDPIGLLDIDPVLNKLRKAIEDPDYIKGLARSLLLENRHRVRLTMVPDPELAERKVQAEAARLAEVKKTLSDQDKQSIVERAKALQDRQTRKDDDSILPKVGLEDIPKEMRYKHGERKRDERLPVATYQAGTNGLTYQQAILELPELGDDELALLPMFCLCVTELGLADSDYLATQRRQSQVVGSLNCFTSIRGNVHDPQRSNGHLILSAKALADNHPKMTALLADTLYSVRFDEHNRIRELIAQMRARREQAVTGNGHMLAMAAASAGMSPVSGLNHRLSGLQGIRAIKELDTALRDPGQLKAFAERLQNLHLKLCRQPIQFLLVSEETHLDQHYRNLQSAWSGIADAVPAGDEAPDLVLLAQPGQPIREGWLAGTQVNFCAKAFPTVPLSHSDAAPLTVLGGVLRNGYLHRAIREQGGAYGAGAQQDSNIGAFRFFSYRDPRIADTLDDFDRSLQWLMKEKHDWQAVEEAILGVVSSIDRPASPAGEAKQAFHSELHGRTRELRETFRQQVLQVKLDDLRRVAETYLLKGQESVAVLTGQGNQDVVSDLKLDIARL